MDLFLHEFSSNFYQFTGQSQFGLFTRCDEIMYNGERKQSCFSNVVHGAWQATAAFTFIGMVLLLPAIVFVLRSYMRSMYLKYSIACSITAGMRFSMECNSYRT
jgi:hypothetical protein